MIPSSQAILAGDQRRAFAIASEAHRHGMARFYDRVAAAMAQVSRLWQEGRIGIADEHLATTVCEAAIASLIPASRGRSEGPRRWWRAWRGSGAHLAGGARPARGGVRVRAAPQGRVRPLPAQCHTPSPMLTLWYLGEKSA